MIYRLFIAESKLMLDTLFKKTELNEDDLFLIKLKPRYLDLDIKSIMKSADFKDNEAILESIHKSINSTIDKSRKELKNAFSGFECKHPMNVTINLFSPQILSQLEPVLDQLWPVFDYYVNSLKYSFLDNKIIVKFKLHPPQKVGYLQQPQKAGFIHQPKLPNYDRPILLKQESGKIPSDLSGSSSPSPSRNSKFLQYIYHSAPELKKIPSSPPKSSSQTQTCSLDSSIDNQSESFESKKVKNSYVDKHGIFKEKKISTSDKENIQNSSRSSSPSPTRSSFWVRTSEKTSGPRISQVTSPSINTTPPRPATPSKKPQ